MSDDLTNNIWTIWAIGLPIWFFLGICLWVLCPNDLIYYNENISQCILVFTLFFIAWPAVIIMWVIIFFGFTICKIKELVHRNRIKESSEELFNEVNKLFEQEGID